MKRNLVFLFVLFSSINIFAMTPDEINSCYGRHPSLNNVADAIFGMSEWNLSEESSNEIAAGVSEAQKAGVKAKTCDDVLKANVILADIGYFNLSLETVSTENQATKERYLNNLRSFICEYAKLVPGFENNYSCGL